MDGKIKIKYNKKKAIEYAYAINPISNIDGNDAQVGADIELKVTIQNNKHKLGIVQAINPTVAVGDFEHRKTEDNWAIDKPITTDHRNLYGAILYGIDGNGTAVNISCGKYKNTMSAEFGQTAVMRDVPRELIHINEIETGKKIKTSFHDLVIFLSDDCVAFVPATFKWGYTLDSEGKFKLVDPSCELGVASRIKKAIRKYYQVCEIKYEDLDVRF